MSDWKAQLKAKAEVLDIKKTQPSGELLGAARHYLTVCQRLMVELEGNNDRRPSREHFTDRELNLAEMLVQAETRLMGLCELEGHYHEDILDRVR